MITNLLNLLEFKKTKNIYIKDVFQVLEYFFETDTSKIKNEDVFIYNLDNYIG